MSLPEYIISESDVEGNIAPSYQKEDILVGKKEEKVNSLLNKNNPLVDPTKPSLENVSVEMDGYSEWAGNKIFNDLNANDVQSIVGQTINDFQILEDDEGLYQQIQGKRIPFSGEARRLYGFTNDEGLFKLGTSRGDLPEAEYRYQPGRAEEEGFSVGSRGYGWAPGEAGVDVNQKQMDILLPSTVATGLELILQGRKEAIQNRALRRPLETTPEFEQQRNALGAGYTEYYTGGAVGVFGDSRDQQSDPKAYENFISLLFSETQDISNLTADDIEDIGKRAAAKRMGVPQRILNTVSAFASGLVKNGLVDVADWALEATNLGDLGTEEEKRRYVNRFFGYNETVLEPALEQAKELSASILADIKAEDKSVDLGEVVALIRTGVVNPEFLGESLGYVAAMFIPWLGFAGKTAKANAAIRGVESQLKAGKITKEVAKSRVLELSQDITNINRAAELVRRNAGLFAVSAGDVNDQIDEYVENTGEVPSFGKIAQMYTTQTLLLAMERWVTIDILKSSPGLVRAIKEAVKGLPAAEYAKVAGKAATVAATVTANMGKEAGQEYLHAIGEALNVNWNLDAAGNVREALVDGKDILTSDETQTDAIMGAGLGAGGAVQYQVAGTALRGAGTAGAAAINEYDKYIESKDQEEEVNTSEGLNAADVAPDIVDRDRKEYSQTITRLFQSFVNDEIQASNLGDFVEDLSALKRLRYSVEGGNKEGLARADTAYNEIKQRVESIIVENEGNVPLTRRVRSALMNEGEDGVLRSAPTEQLVIDFTDKERATYAEEVIETVLEGKEGNIPSALKPNLSKFAEVNKVDRKRYDKLVLSYETVKEESTVGNRGIVGRARRLDTILASGTATTEQIMKEYDEAVRFLEGTKRSIAALNKAINDAEILANTANRAVRQPNTRRPLRVVSEYNTNPNSTSKGSPFVVYVRHDGEKWVADTVEAQRRVDAKKETEKGLLGLIGKFNKEADEFIDFKYDETIDTDSLNLDNDVVNKLSDLELVRQAIQNGVYTGDRTLTDVLSEIAQIRQSTVENTGILDADITRAVQSNIEQTKRVAKEAKKRAADRKKTLEIKNKELESIVEKELREEIDNKQSVTRIVKGWYDAAREGLTGKDLESRLAEIADKEGVQVRKADEEISSDAKGSFVLGQLAKDLLTRAVGVTRDTKKVYTVVKNFYDNNGNVTNTTETVMLKVSDKYRNAKGTFQEGKNIVSIEAIKEISIDPSTYLTYSGPTVLNTLAVSSLPAVLERIGKQAHEVLTNILAPLQDGEKDVLTRDGGKFKANNLWVLDSPARHLIFNNNGSLSPTVSTAVSVALHDALFTDRYKLTLGPKTKLDVATMFKVLESEVTPEMMKFAKDHGVFGKTLANSLGKSVLKSLGIRKKGNSEVSKDSYEKMATDLGNIGIKLGEELNILQTKEVPSNLLASMYSDGLVKQGVESTTLFVNLKSREVLDNDTGIRKEVPLNVVQKALEDYEEINELIPDAVNKKVWPSTKPFTQERINEATKEVRNDLVDAAIPATGKETIAGMMNTPYVLDMKVANEFIEKMQDKEFADGIKRNLGFIEVRVGNPEYDQLTYEDKIIQEAINREVEDSVNNIIQLAEFGENDLYFLHSYTRNHRYMMDSNTVNPQGNKLHRFFVQPKSHRTTYKYDKSNNTFNYKYSKDGETVSKDASYLIRLALAQAFGAGVDKTKTSELVQLGNAILSLNTDQLNVVEKELVTKGEVVLKVEGIDLKLEAEHISHSLQALNFLREYQLLGNKGEITTSLTVEFDALTSGFSNKVQQFGSLDNLSEHRKRVGVLDEEVADKSDYLNQSVGINDMLADPENRDSYKNLGFKTIEIVRENVENLSQGGKNIFKGIAGVIPGGNMSLDNGEIVIDSALRNLFKPGFMVFNYSASINRIVTNLGNEMLDSMFKSIAKSDLKDKNSAEYLAAKTLADLVDGVNTVEQLQDKLRNESLDRLKVKVTLMDKGNRVVNVKLADYLNTTVIKQTFGKAVEEVFNSEFENYIRIQDSTNDAFKVMFNLFDTALNEKVKEYRKEGNYVVSEETMKTFINELKPLFPIIAGPLSQELDDGVYIYDTDTRTPDTVRSTGPSPRIRLRKGDKASRKINPIVKQLTSAVNAGSVIPFHAIDGAGLAESILNFSKNYVDSKMGLGVTPIHDAAMAPLPFSEEMGYEYNKAIVDINSRYSILQSIVDMFDKVNDMLDEDTEINVNNAFSKTKPTRGLSINRGEEKTNSFKLDFETVYRNLTDLNNVVNSQRPDFYKTGTLVSAMVGTPGSNYVIDSTIDGPNLSYMNYLRTQFRKVDVRLDAEPEVEAATQETVVDVASDPVQQEMVFSSRTDTKKVYNKLNEITKGCL